MNFFSVKHSLPDTEGNLSHTTTFLASPTPFAWGWKHWGQCRRLYVLPRRPVLAASESGGSPGSVR